MNPGVACAVGTVFGLAVGVLAGLVLAGVLFDGRRRGGPVPEYRPTRDELAAMLSGGQVEPPGSVQPRVRPWRAPRSGGYFPASTMPEPTTPPHGSAGASSPWRYGGQVEPDVSVRPPLPPDPVVRGDRAEDEGPR